MALISLPLLSFIFLIGTFFWVCGKDYRALIFAIVLCSIAFILGVALGTGYGLIEVSLQ